MLCPLYISEMASPETRGSLVSLEQFSIVLGVVLGFWVGFFTRSINGALSWRIPLGIQIGPGIILALGTFWLPPSPRHLVLNGKEERALETLARLRDRDENDQLIQVGSPYLAGRPLQPYPFSLSLLRCEWKLGC